MALYKRKEFQELCKVTKGYLNMYIKRGAVVLTQNMIDDELEPNKYFMEKRVDKTVAESPTQSPTKPTRALSEEAVAQVKEQKEKGPPKEASEMFGLGLEKKRLDIKKVQSEIDTAKMKREKMAGELIPTDLVMIIFGSHFKSVTISFHQAADNFLSTIAKQNDLNREQVAKVRGQLNEVVNKAVKAAIVASKKNVKKLVAEYSQSKGKGEKE